MNPLMLLVNVILYVNNLCYLVGAVIRYVYFNWASQQHVYMPVEYGIKPRQLALAEILIVSGRMGLTKPWLKFCRTVAEVKNWRKV